MHSTRVTGDVGRVPRIDEGSCTTVRSCLNMVCQCSCVQGLKALQVKGEADLHAACGAVHEEACTAVRQSQHGDAHLFVVEQPDLLAGAVRQHGLRNAPHQREEARRIHYKVPAHRPPFTLLCNPPSLLRGNTVPLHLTPHQTSDRTRVLKTPTTGPGSKTPTMVNCSFASDHDSRIKDSHHGQLLICF